MQRPISPTATTDIRVIGNGKHLAIVAEKPQALEENCGLLVRAALSHGFVVSCLAPGFPAGRANGGVLNGAFLQPIEVRAGDSAPLKSRLAHASIASFCCARQPDAIIACSIAVLPAMSGNLAGPAGSPKISCLITPADEIDVHEGSWWRRWELPYKLAHCETIFTSDWRLYSAFCQNQSLMKKSKVVLTPGPGCDLEALQMQELPSGDLVVALLDNDNPGFLKEFSDTARQLFSPSRNLKFIVARRACYATDVDHEQGGEPWLEYRTYTLNREIDVIAPAHIIVLGPTRMPYPAPLMSALATGRPLIAKDTPAMRDAIDEVVNGVLVATGETKSLDSAMKLLLRRPDLLASMGRASRVKAERRFDTREINAAVLAQLGIA